MHGSFCVFLLKFSDDENGLALDAGYKHRLMVLEAVGGETVVIVTTGAPAEKFERFLPQAREGAGHRSVGGCLVIKRHTGNWSTASIFVNGAAVGCPG